MKRRNRRVYSKQPRVEASPDNYQLLILSSAVASGLCGVSSIGPSFKRGVPSLAVAVEPVCCPLALWQSPLYVLTVVLLTGTLLSVLQLSSDIGYVLYSALGSFYVPSIIMIFVYIRIYFAARSRARRYVKRRPRAGPTAATPQTAVEVHHSMPPSGDTDSRKSSTGSEVAPASRSRASLCIRRGAVPTPTGESPPLALVPVEAEANGRTPLSETGEPERSSSDFGPQTARCHAVLPLRRHLRTPVWGRKTSKAKREMIDMGRLKVRVEPPAATETSAVEVSVRHRDPDREKRRIARKKEKRATLILGLIMGSFIACWLPFFFLYVLVPLCNTCHVDDWGFAFAFWLGYMNSALNPVIYTIFNKDFRRAFRRILFK